MFDVVDCIRIENDSKLFTPGPLTTSLTVKQSMLHDLGSRDTVFINIVAHIRAKILNLASKNSSRMVDFNRWDLI